MPLIILENFKSFLCALSILIKLFHSYFFLIIIQMMKSITRMMERVMVEKGMVREMVMVMVR